MPYREVVPQLKTVLPDGEEEALRFVDALIEGGEDAVSESPEAFREWVRAVIKAEYATMRRFAKYERKRRPKGSGSSPKRSKKKPAPKPPEE